MFLKVIAQILQDRIISCIKKDDVTDFAKLVCWYLIRINQFPENEQFLFAKIWNGCQGNIEADPELNVLFDKAMKNLCDWHNTNDYGKFYKELRENIEAYENSW